jgi:hypothetical protein
MSGFNGSNAMDAVAETYLRLVLAIAEHDADYYDIYHAPDAWREAAANKPLPDVAAEAEALLAEIPAPPADADETVALRHGFLRAQVGAVAARARLLLGEEMRFDDESQALYNVVAPRFADEHFLEVLAEIDVFLAKEGFVKGTLTERSAAFRAQFVIPRQRLDRVVRAAIDTCRERTHAHVELPDETFELEYVQDVSWQASNGYRRGYHSLIQINTDLPIVVETALDLACHEGYPGHHVYHTLLDKHLVHDRGWIEYNVYPLFSPQSLVAEGTANFGIEMTFPGAERLAYEQDVLYPLAGLDPEKAASYEARRQLRRQLDYAVNEVARRYLDGELDAPAAVEWYMKHAGTTRLLAERRIHFIREYRSYVLNYTLGEDLVRDWVHAQAPPDDPEARWRVFARLLASPRLAGDLC